MRKFLLVAATAILAAVFPRAIAAQDAVPVRAGLVPVVERLESLIRQEMTEKEIPAASIAVVEGNRVTWARGFGMARPGEKMPATASTVYRAGSVSKLFTDLAVMQLVEAGKLNLDAPVQTYLPDFQPKNPFDVPITLRLLMSHGSGLVRETPVGNFFDADPPDLATTVLSLNDTTLVYKPGAKTKYSNAALAVVGRVVEKVRGEPFAKSVAGTLIEPLGLESTGFECTPEIQKSLAQGQMWTYDGRTFVAPTFLLGTSAAGNLYSSVLDLGRFLGMLLEGGRGIIKPESLHSMWERQAHDEKTPQGFGLGFSISALNGHRRVGHGGAVYGFATEVAALPDDGIGVAVVLTKDCANTSATRIANTALRCLLAVKRGEPLPSIAPTTPLPDGLAARLAGHYGEADDAIDLSSRAGRLVLTQARGGFRLEVRARGTELETDGVLGSGLKLHSEGDSIRLDGKPLRRVEGRKPGPVPARWAGLVGEYGWDHNTLYILEREGRLFALIEWFFYDPLEEQADGTFKFPERGLYLGESIKFRRDRSGRAIDAVTAGVAFPRRQLDGDDGSTVHIEPLRPVPELRAEALRAKPPVEDGEFRTPELVDLKTLDEGIKQDVRYAGENNFLRAPFYSSPRTFMQKPAAEALARVHGSLGEEGYGLLIHDAYRPWFVSKMFWDATPEANHAFVADPSKGSKHNRGCAVDLTLYDKSTGQPVEMTGGYDEFSTRSSPDYPGGTSLQRCHRELLRSAMERQGFTVNEVEWWHFDFKDWPKYPIMNTPFEQLGLASNPKRED